LSTDNPTFPDIRRRTITRSEYTRLVLQGIDDPYKGYPTGVNIPSKSARSRSLSPDPSVRSKRHASETTQFRFYPEYLIDTSTSGSGTTTSTSTEAKSSSVSTNSEDLDQTLTLEDNENHPQEEDGQQQEGQDHIEQGQAQEEPENDNANNDNADNQDNQDNQGGDGDNNDNGDDEDQAGQHNENNQEIDIMADTAAQLAASFNNLTMCQTAQLFLPKPFEGKLSQNIEDFFRSLDNYLAYTKQAADTNDDVKEARLLLLNTLLLNTPKIYLAEEVEAVDKDTYDKVKNLLINKYGPKKRGLTYRLQLSTKRMEPTQTVEEFSKWFCDTCKLAGIVGSEKRTMYLERLTRPLKGFVLEKDSNPATYEKVYELALMGESINALKADVDPAEEHAAKTVLSLKKKRSRDRDSEVQYLQRGQYSRGRGRGNQRGRGRGRRQNYNNYNNYNNYGGYNRGRGNRGSYRGNRGNSRGRGRGRDNQNYNQSNYNQRGNFNYRGRGEGRGRGTDNRRQAAPATARVQEESPPTSTEGEEQPWEYQ
jgi:hypothetical protein